MEPLTADEGGSTIREKVRIVDEFTNITTQSKETGI